MQIIPPGGMSRHLSARSRWVMVIVFAIAMAVMEAATVFYLRSLVDRLEPYQPNPVPLHGALGQIELWREAATLVMIAMAGLLAGWTWRDRLGYAAIAFGTWDISYYVFLRPMSAWPTTVLDWDLLFLLPLPWWGPVIAPVSIAALMVAWGTLSTQTAAPPVESRWTWALGGAGIALALVVFMADAWLALPLGRDVALQVLPRRFNWPLFSIAWILMAAPVVAQLLMLANSGRRERCMP